MPEIDLTVAKNDLEYQLRNDFREIVEEIVTKLIKDEF